MHCQNCGIEVFATTVLCPQCGHSTQVAAAKRDLLDDPAMRMLLPVGRSLWAIAAGYAGLFAVLCLPAPLALILGEVAIYDLKHHPDKHGWGRAIFGAVMGGLGTLLLLVVLSAALFSR